MKILMPLYQQQPTSLALKMTARQEHNIAFNVLTCTHCVGFWHVVQ